MKKVLVILACAGLLMMTGCSKTCKCTLKGNVGDYSGSSTKTVKLDKGERCSDYNESFSVAGIGLSYDCKAQF